MRDGPFQLVHVRHGHRSPAELHLVPGQGRPHRLQIGRGSRPGARRAARPVAVGVRRAGELGDGDPQYVGDLPQHGDLVESPGAALDFVDPRLGLAESVGENLLGHPAQAPPVRDPPPHRQLVRQSSPAGQPVHCTNLS